MICASVGAFGFTVIMLFVAAFSGESAAAALADGTKLLFWFYVIAATTWLLCFALEIKIARIIAAAEKSRRRLSAQHSPAGLPPVFAPLSALSF